MAAPYRIDVRVYYEDTDFSGFVYHANYLRFLERGRSECLRSLGLTHTALLRDEAGLVFVVARLSIDFQRPARMDDLLAVETLIRDARGPIVRFDQKVTRDGEVLVSAEVTVVAVREGRPVRLPTTFRAAFEAATQASAADQRARAPGQAE